jgi:AraC-like DNA-binding protein
MQNLHIHCAAKLEDFYASAGQERTSWCDLSVQRCFTWVKLFLMWKWSFSGEAISDVEMELFGSSICRLRDNLAYDPRLLTLWEAIEERFADPEFNLTEASRRCGMSKNNLNSVLKRLTGHTCCELLTAYRIYRSVVMALAANHSFTDIAQNCGFDNSSSYSRAVRRLLKKSPRGLLPRSDKYRRELNFSQ